MFINSTSLCGSILSAYPSGGFAMPLRFYVKQWAVVGEVAGVQHLYPCIMLAVKGRHRTRATRINRVLRRVEPQP
jgi:hypothetical protein